MLKEGTKVRMKNDPSNEYLHQGKDKDGNLMEGEIISQYKRAQLYYSVKWSNDSRNAYSDKHIEPIEKTVINNYQIY